MFDSPLHDWTPGDITAFGWPWHGRADTTMPSGGSVTLTLSNGQKIPIRGYVAGYAPTMPGALQLFKDPRAQKLTRTPEQAAADASQGVEWRPEVLYSPQARILYGSQEIAQQGSLSELTWLYHDGERNWLAALDREKITLHPMPVISRDRSKDLYGDTKLSERVEILVPWSTVADSDQINGFMFLDATQTGNRLLVGSWLFPMTIPYDFDQIYNSSKYYETGWPQTQFPSLIYEIELTKEIVDEKPVYKAVPRHIWSTLEAGGNWHTVPEPEGERAYLRGEVSRTGAGTEEDPFRGTASFPVVRSANAGWYVGMNTSHGTWLKGGVVSAYYQGDKIEMVTLDLTYEAGDEGTGGGGGRTISKSTFTTEYNIEPGEYAIDFFVDIKGHTNVRATLNMGGHSASVQFNRTSKQSFRQSEGGYFYGIANGGPMNLNGTGSVQWTLTVGGKVIESASASFFLGSSSAMDDVGMGAGNNSISFWTGGTAVEKYEGTRQVLFFPIRYSNDVFGLGIALVDNANKVTTIRGDIITRTGVIPRFEKTAAPIRTRLFASHNPLTGETIVDSLNPVFWI